MNGSPHDALHLLQCHPDVRKLALWGHRNGLLRTPQETGFQKDDPGYVFHALMKAAFGTLAPKPFWYRVGREGLLAFTRHDPEALRQNASLAVPDVTAALGLNPVASDLGLASRKYPDRWASGHRLAFETRLRPVVRLKAAEGRAAGAERDAFLAHLDRLPAETRADRPMAREAVYIDWLGRQLAREDAAQLESAQVMQYRLTSVLRQQGLREDGRRVRSMVSGPEVVIAGTLTVANPEAFASLLARGLGRHRAFGFGLLLLRPAG